MRRLLLLRPEPALGASAMRARMLGLEVIARPLFAVQPLAWDAPNPAGFDALLLTSAAATELAGPQVAMLHGLIAHCVGSATAEAARAAGLTIGNVGNRGIHGLLATLPGTQRLLHLAGADRAEAGATRHQISVIPVYAAGPITEPGLPTLDGLVVAVHSPRAARRLVELAQGRGQVIIAAISQATADALGSGWEDVAVAERPDDSSLLALAARLCQK